MDSSKSGKGLLIAKAAFWSACVFTLVMATNPQPPQVPMPDKLLHAAAFFVLTALHKMAYRDFGFWRRIAAMAVLGGAIELIQSIPDLHRDADIKDWVADIAAAILASWIVSGLSARRGDT